MKQFNKRKNDQKLVDERVELVLFVDLETGTYEVVHDAGRIEWNPQIPGDYHSFMKYIEKHIEHEDEKNNFCEMFSMQKFQNIQVRENAEEHEYLITMQGRYENISLVQYRMEEIAGYEHTGVLAIKLLTAEKEAQRKHAGLYQVAGCLCQMAVLVQLQGDRISFLVIPEYLREQAVNLPKTYEGFLYEMVQMIHVQDQEIVKHVLSRAYLEDKFAKMREFSIQVRCKGENDSFEDIDIICKKTDLLFEPNSLDFVLIVQNITEEKRQIEVLQQQIQQLEGKLVEAKEEKEELCSMIARELHKR